MFNSLILSDTLAKGEFILAWWHMLIIVIGVIVVTALVTFFVVKKLFARQLEKNPPINEKMVRVMMQQMGRTPSEKQVRAVMNSIKENK